jgi:CTP synthase (UTP-ammonia lyase)
VLGIKDADSAENNSGSGNIIISPVACAVPNRSSGAPKLAGAIPKIRIRPGSYLHSCYKKDTATEGFFCNYEVNPEFEWTVIEAGFPIVARGAQGEARAIESPAHRFFIATLFQPQLSSKRGKPHPIVVEFLRTAAKWKIQKLEDSVLE